MILEILNTISQLIQQKKNKQLYRTGWSNDFNERIVEYVDSPSDSKKIDERIEKNQSRYSKRLFHQPLYLI